MQCENFDFNLRRGYQKNSYERHDHESVDEMSLSYDMSQKNYEKRIQAFKG